MNFKMPNWKSIVGTVAPTIAGALGTPLMGMAVSAICGVLGLSPDSDEDTIQKAIANADPSMLLKMKEAEQQFKLDMEKLQVDLAGLQVKDRDSARQREIGVKDNVNRNLAYMTVAAFLAVTGVAFVYEIPDKSKELVFMIIGALLMRVADIYGYYFGSSIGSREKTQMMSDTVAQARDDAQPVVNHSIRD